MEMTHAFNHDLKTAVTPVVRQRGFTLIELLITVAIIGILAAIAYPNYTAYVQRSARADAAASLASAAQVMERQFTTNNAYPAAVSGFDTSKYAVSVAAGTATTFSLLAAPAAGWSDADCGGLTLTNLGAKGISGGTSTIAQCWGR